MLGLLDKQAEFLPHTGLDVQEAEVHLLVVLLKVKHQDHSKLVQLEGGGVD